MKLEKIMSPFSLAFGAARDLWIKADAAAANRDPAAAARIYRHLAKRKPKDAEGYQYCALSHYRLNKPESAIGILEAGLRQHPEASSHYLLNHYVNISSEMKAIARVIRFIQADAAENAHVCKMLLDMRFDASHVRSNLLEYCLEQGYIDLALQGSDSIEGGYDTLLILWKLGDTLLQQGRIDDAESVYRKISVRERTTQEDYYYAGLAESRLKNQAGALAIFEAALQTIPASRSGYLFEHYIRFAAEISEIERAISFAQSIDAASELQICEMLFAMDPIASHVWVNLFEYCLKRGLVAQGERYLESIKTKYADTETSWRLADILNAHGRGSEAKELYGVIAARKPNTQMEYHYTAMSDYRLKNPDAAVARYEEALTRFTEDVSVFLFESYFAIAAEIGQLDRVIEFTQTLHGISEEDAYQKLFSMPMANAHIRVALIGYSLKHGMDDRVAAGLAFMDKNHDEIASQWMLADLLHNHGGLSRADADTEEIYRAISARKPDTQLEYHCTAMSAYRLKDTEAAVARYEEALTRFAKDASVFLFESYFAIAVEIGLVDRVVGFTQTLHGIGEEDAYQILFGLPTANANIRVALIGYSLKHGLKERVVAGLAFMDQHHNDIVSQWMLADLLQNHGRMSEAIADVKDLYKAIWARNPETRMEYHCTAMSAYRLKNPDAAVARYEEALARFSEDAGVFLFESYFAIAVEIGLVDRAIGFTQTLHGLSEEDAYEKLFGLPMANAHIRIALIGYCLKHGMDERAAAGFAFMDRNHDDIVSQWMLADLLQKHGRISEAEAIYTQLAERVPVSAEDYYYASVAQLRLGRSERCLDIVEQGQRLYPDAELLSTLYVQLCATNLDYDRYSRFKWETSRDAEKVLTSKLDFYKLAIRNGAAEAFILNYKEIGSVCEAASFKELQDDFLSMLEKDPPSFDRAKIIVFFSRYLDADSVFTARLFDVLQHAKVTNSEIDSARHTLQMLYTLTPPMIPHFQADPRSVADKFIMDCLALSENAVALHEPITDMTNNWTPWQYIFCLAVPDMYHKALGAFEKIAFATWPRLQFTSPYVSERLAAASAPGRKIRIGFTVHDSMPMMSGLMAHLDRTRFETVFLRPGPAGTSAASKNWVARAGETIEYSDVDTYAAIETIAEQKLDIIISGPAIAAIFYPMMARLAPLQMVLLEPNWTDGFTNSDYYISWQRAEPNRPADFYQSAVGFLEHPPYWIERHAMMSDSSLSEEKRNEIRQRVLGCGPESRVYLCANTLPKIHPLMDDIFYALLDRDRSANLVLLRGDYPPGKSLKARLKERLGPYYDRVKFLKTLSKDDAHSLLQAVDCSLDSYPLCGMSSSFDGMMLGVPIVTLPSDIPFGNWTAAIYDYIDVHGLTAKNVDEYVAIAMRLASDRNWRQEKSEEVRKASLRYVESKESAEEFQEFIIQAWERKRTGLPVANWLSGTWQ